MAARLQRWSSFLSSYDYSIECHSTKENANADFCTRLPLEHMKVNKVHVSSVDEFYTNQWESLPVTADTVRRCTRTDRELSQIHEYTLSAWPKSVSQHMQTFFNRRNEMSINQGCLVWGTGVVLPKSLREQLLHEVHTGHLGIVRMKHVARSFIWWPGIDSDMENQHEYVPMVRRVFPMDELILVA